MDQYEYSHVMWLLTIIRGRRDVFQQEDYSTNDIQPAWLLNEVKGIKHVLAEQGLLPNHLWGNVKQNVEKKQWPAAASRFSNSSPISKHSNLWCRKSLKMPVICASFCQSITELNYIEFFLGSCQEVSPGKLWLYIRDFEGKYASRTPICFHSNHPARATSHVQMGGSIPGWSCHTGCTNHTGGFQRRWRRFRWIRCIITFYGA